jgi:hypothetical protein
MDAPRAHRRQYPTLAHLGPKWTSWTSRTLSITGTRSRKQRASSAGTRMRFARRYWLVLGLIRLVAESSPATKRERGDLAWLDGPLQLGGGEDWGSPTIASRPPLKRDRKGFCSPTLVLERKPPNRRSKLAPRERRSGNVSLPAN